jgi:hypothetical protein
MSFLVCPPTRLNMGPPPQASPPAKDEAPQWLGLGPRTEAAAPRPAPPSGPARRSRQAPAPAWRRPGSQSHPRSRLLTGGAAVRTHLRSRPLPGHPQRRRGGRPLGQRGGRGRWAQAAAEALLPGPAPARLRAPGQPSAPGAGPEPAVPACPARPRAPSAPRRPAPPRRRSPLSPPPARLRAAPAGSGTGPAHRGRGSPHPRPAAGRCRPRLPEKGSRERKREGAGTLKGAAATASVVCGPRSLFRRSLGPEAVSHPLSPVPFTFSMESGPEDAWPKDGETSVVVVWEERKELEA